MLITAYPSAADAAAHSATRQTLYCGLVKRQLVPVAFPGPPPALRTPVTTDGQEVCDLRFCAEEFGLAMLRLDTLDKSLAAGSAEPTPRVPEWLRPQDRNQQLSYTN